MSANTDVALAAIHAVERRDPEALLALYHPEIEFVEAPSLPYGGTYNGTASMFARGLHETWLETWDPLQPTDAERAMDPRVIAAEGDEVAVLRRHRAVGSDGERFDQPVLAVFEVRDGLITRAQMFHFDTVAVVGFLSRAARPSG